MGGEGFGFCVRRKGTGSQVMEAKRNGPGEKKKSWASRGQKGLSGARRQQASRYVLEVRVSGQSPTVTGGRHTHTTLTLTTCKGKKGFKWATTGQAFGRSGQGQSRLCDVVGL